MKMLTISELLSDLAKKSLERTEPEENPLTVLHTACQGCVPSRIYGNRPLSGLC